MQYLAPFLAGFLSTLTFHQGTLAALPGERATGADSPADAPSAADELASRRRRRTTA